MFGTSAENRPALSSLSFTLSGKAPASIAGSAIRNEAQNVIAGAAHLNLTPPIGAAHDWAVAKLDRPACVSGGLPLANAATPSLVYQVAVHKDIASPELQFDSGCAYGAAFPNVELKRLARDFANSRSVMLHDCDTGAGSSGSPMLADRDGAPEVVGVNVGVYVAERVAPSAADGVSAPRQPIANTAIAVAPLARALAELQSRDLLTTPNEIIRVQRGLAALALYDGEATGQADETLIAAVRAYERKRSRAETGLLTKQLLAEFDAH